MRDDDGHLGGTKRREIGWRQAVKLVPSATFDAKVSYVYLGSIHHHTCKQISFEDGIGCHVVEQAWTVVKFGLKFYI